MIRYNVGVEDDHTGELLARNVTLFGLLWTLFRVLPLFRLPHHRLERWDQIVIRNPKD